MAGDLSGGLLNTTVAFTGTELSHDFTITTPPGTAPAADKTGRVAVLGPGGLPASPSQASANVKIPKPGVVAPPAGVLPPQYTDPNLAGMSPAATPPGGWTVPNLRTLLGTLSNTAACKTTFVELPDSFDFGTATVALNYKGWVDTSVTPNKIYPLVLCSQRTRLKSRAAADVAKVGALPPPQPERRPMAVAVRAGGRGAARHRPRRDLPGRLFHGDPARRSADCFITRCWLDSPGCTRTNTPVRARIGANDVYGTPRDLTQSELPPNGDPWMAQLYFICNGKTVATQSKPKGVLIYQNYIGNIRAPNVWPTASRPTPRRACTRARASSRARAWCRPTPTCPTTSTAPAAPRPTTAGSSTT